MNIIESIDALGADYKGCAVTIGNFDGVHLGHQEIIRQVCLAAEKRGTKSVAMTFFPHPVAVLHPEKSPGMLTPPELKQKLLEKHGLDGLIILETNYKLMNLSGEDFIKRFLIEPLAPAIVIEGSDFNFGYGRSGGTKTLKKLGMQNNFDVKIVPAREIEYNGQNNTKISSTLIRHLLHQGRVAVASEALGRNYRLIGEVHSGRGRGEQLGFPTANISPARQIIPAEGVYAGFVETGSDSREVCGEGKKLPAIFSIGRAKTFVSDHPLLIESHILDRIVGNLYGKWLAMDFVKYIRAQQRFENEHKLSYQIAKDCEIARQLLELPLSSKE